MGTRPTRVLWDLDRGEEATPCGLAVLYDDHVAVEVSEEYGWARRITGERRKTEPDGTISVVRPGDPGYFEEVLHDLSHTFAVTNDPFVQRAAEARPSGSDPAATKPGAKPSSSDFEVRALAAEARVRELEEALEHFVMATVPLLPVQGSWQMGFAPLMEFQLQLVATAEEWSDAAHWLCEAHRRALSPPRRGPVPEPAPSLPPCPECGAPVNAPCEAWCCNRGSTGR